MTERVRRDSGSGFRRLREDTVHEGYVWTVATADFESPAGDVFTRDIVRSPGAVGVLPIIFDAEGNGSVVLVAQYRPPYDDIVVEIPAGMRDIPGEAPADVARRELVEEAGLSAGRVEHLIDVYPSPGLTDSITSIFLATECTPVPTDRQGPEEQEMDVILHPLDEAVRLVEEGSIHDAKTVVAVLLAARRLESADRG